MSKKASTDQLPEFAHAWLAQRRLATARLEEMRLEELSQMTESDAARIFEQLDPPRPYELRPSSGLIEQQRWFRLLFDKQRTEPA